MLVQLTNDAVINTDYITHMNGLADGATTSIHYKGKDASQVVRLPLSEVVRLVNEAHQQVIGLRTLQKSKEIWTPHLTD